MNLAPFRHQLQGLDSSGAYGSLEEPSGPALDWCSNGDPAWLLLQAFRSILNQIVALGVIIWSVFFQGEYLMSCNPLEVGYVRAVACEYTKAYARCFPLLALNLSLLIAARELLQHRIYYQMLRHGALLDIENFSPLADPIFWVVIFCAANACMHFVINIAYSQNLNLAHPAGTVAAIQGSAFIAEVQREATFYIVPTFVLIMFVYGSYDTESSLLPLSKFFEENPDEARALLGSVPFISEPAAAAAVEEVCSGQEIPSSLHGAYLQVKDRALTRMSEGDVPQLSRWRLLSTMWPAKLLLHGRLTDDDNRRFRLAWYCFSGLSFVIVVAIFCFFVYNFMQKAQDIFGGPIHQWTDIAGAVVNLGFVAMNLSLAWALLRTVLVPFQTGGTIPSWPLK